MIGRPEQLLIFLIKSALFDFSIDTVFLSNVSVDDWKDAYRISSQHGITALTFDGINQLPSGYRPPKEVMLQWFGQQLTQEKRYSQQRMAVEELVAMWKDAGIQVKELKGNDIGQYYPYPEHRYSCDFDCFLSDFEAGNDIVEAKGVKVNRDFYKNSSFTWEGLYVENHQFCTPVRGNKEMKHLELVLRENINNVNFNALFLMEHMWAHFFEDALCLKQLVDWLVFRHRFWNDVDEALFEKEARACGFYQFALSINQIADALLDCNAKFHFEDNATQRLWEQILSGGGSVEMNNGWRTRFQLICNYFRNRWRYKEFCNHSAFFVLARTTFGFVFDKNPKI